MRCEGWSSSATIRSTAVLATLHASVALRKLRELPLSRVLRPTLYAHAHSKNCWATDRTGSRRMGTLWAPPFWQGDSNPSWPFWKPHDQAVWKAFQERSGGAPGRCRACLWTVDTGSAAEGVCATCIILQMRSCGRKRRKFSMTLIRSFWFGTDVSGDNSGILAEAEPHVLTSTRCCQVANPDA